MKKRVLSMLMALALCLTLLPAPVRAAEDTPESGAIVQEEQQEEQNEAPAAESPDISEQAAENGIAAQNGEDSTVENAVAEVTIDGTTTQYANIDAAFAAAQQAGSATVKLLTDVTTTSEIEVDSGTFTIDLNGKKLDRTSPFTLSVKENGNVTVTSTQGTGTISNAQSTAIFVNNGATVHVTKGVRLNQLYAMKNAKLTLDVGVIITGNFFTQADNIAPFLTGKALQSCDENGTLIEGQYKSIYDSYRVDDTGCVIVIEHTSHEGTPSAEHPCPICGYDGTPTQPTEPENPNPDVAEVNGTKYKTLAEAIKAANGADITLLTIVTENVVVDGASIKASIILGNGKTIDDIPYPSNWVADRYGIPLTMEAGEITLKDGALAQFSASSSADVAIALKGGTLIVETTVTKIIGSNRSDSVQHAAIEATGGVLDLQGNTLLDGGLTMSGNAQLKNKLTAGTFTNSGSDTYSVSVEGSSQYTTVFDLLETGYAFAEYDADNEGDTTGDVIAKDTTTSELTEDVAVIKCTHKGANNKSLFKDNTCTGCGFTCAHETVKNGVCTGCKQQMKAKASASDGTEKYYLELQEAFEGVADGGTVTMLTKLTDDDTISFCCDAEGKPVEKTVTLMMNGHSLSYEGAPSLNIQSGKLIIGDEATISQPAKTAQPAVFVDNDEQSKDRGTLEFKGKANLTGGLLIQNYGKLVGGLKEGMIITSNGTYSVSVENSYTYSNVLGLLGDGLAFAKKDNPTELVNGNVKQLTEDVIVVAHTHSMKCAENPNQDAFRKYIYRCDCGFVCPHEHFTNSICDTCHAACTHDEDDGFGSCAYCGAPFAVRVEHTDGVGLTSNKLYMKTTAQDGTDDTLQQVFNEAADGSTVTLLVDGLRASGEVTGKTITLDLNGHSLSGYSLNVGGLTATSQVRTGNLTVIDSSGGNGAVGVTVRDGGTLVFDPKNDSTTLLQLEVWGGTVELYGGKISRSGLRLNNSITLGNLLPQKAGLAYYCGDTQLTLEEAASKTCDLVVKSCTHGDKNGFDKNATACPYCNAPAVAETDLNDGKGGRLRRRFANLQTAIDADRDGGTTLQLLADVTGDYTIDGTKDTRLDLNGHCIKGTVTVKTATGNNTTTFSNTQNTTTAGIDVVVAYKGAKLVGSDYPAVISKLTLADTTKWKDILQQTTNIGFMVTNTDGAHTWYAPDDVKGSQLNNVIINYDKAAPDWSGSESGIRIKSTWWNKLLSFVTFGLYKGSSLDVYAKANDSLSGVAEYYYYIDNSGSTTTLTAEELANKSFTKVAADKNGTTKLTEITSDNNYVIYAYAVDAAGNRSAYISSDGVVLDNTAPELTNVSTPAKSNGTLSDTSATITFNGSEAGTYYYILKEDGNTAPTQMSDFATKTAGDKVDTWTAKEGVSTGTLAADEANTIILTGLKAHTSYVLYLAATDAAGNASVAESAGADGDSGVVFVSFTTTKTIPYVKTAPVLSGNYGDTVSAMLEKADITKASVTAGQNSDTKIEGTWTPASEDADEIPAVGTSEKYILTFTPTGSDADTYDSVTCEVTPEVSKKQITVVISDKEKFYGEANPALTWSLATGDAYADNVLVAGDTEEALGISLSTTAKDNSNVGTYAITGLSDSANYEVSFSGSDSDGKSGVMTVKQAAKAPNMPENAMTPAHSTKRVGDIILPEGWSWQEADKDTVLADGVAVTATAVYTGADKGNYETESVSITITRSECDHTHTEIRNQREATCKEAGYSGDTYCADCGEKLATGTATGKKPHTVGTPATCVSKAVCSVCGESFGEVDATNHVHTTVKNRKEATCTQTGYTGDTYCTDCNKLLRTGEELAALGHDYKATVTKQPTTTEEGVRTYTCTRCNSSYTESIAKLPEEQHTHNYTGSITKEATCTEAGVRTYTCSCGNSYTENIPATGHSYVSKVTKAATTTEEGIMTYTCSKCGHSYTQPITKIKSDDSSKDNGSQNQKPQSGTDNGNQNQKPQPDTDNGKEKGDSIKPYIKDDSGKEGWDVIKPQLEEAKAGDTVTVAMNGTTVVPKDVIDSIKGKDTTLVLDMGNGLSWKIYGKDITDAAGDIDFDVTVGADAGKSIPVDVINNVTGERSSLNLTLAYDGEFGFTATLTVNMESKNAGLYANLFYYNEQTGELEFISAGQIDPDGNVELVFTHASDYTIVVDTKIMSDNGQADNKADETIPASKTDDSTSKYTWNNTIIIIGICIMLIVIGAIFYVRKKSGSEE